MKVALVHDYIKEYGGAEKVLETLSEIYPEAPIYTAFYSPSFLGSHRERFNKMDIRTTWFQNTPFKNKLLSYFRLIAPFVFKSLDLSDYDVIITSATGTYTSPNFVKKKKDAKLFCYCHTPPRYLYGYSTAAPWKSVWWRKLLYLVGLVPIHFIRLLDFKSAQIPDYFIANSEEVSKRIKKFYRRDPKIIYPPVQVKEGYLNQKKGNYLLAGGRLARPKHVDLAVLVCTKMGFPLKVFGREFSGYGSELKRLAGPTVEFLGEVTDEEKWKLYEQAKVFIFPAEDEDFGIMPVEAMSVGTAVIAYRSGGVKETVIDNKTGILFNDLTTESLTAAIKKFESLKINPMDCNKQSQKFSKERFKEEIENFIASKSKN